MVQLLLHLMKNLCSFVGLDYYPEILNYREGMEKYFGEEDFNALHQSLQTPFDLSKIGEWEHKLPRRKALRCEVLGGRFAEEIGYRPKTPIDEGIAKFVAWYREYYG